MPLLNIIGNTLPSLRRILAIMVDLTTDPAARDALGRVRNAIPELIRYSSFESGDDPLIWETKATGGAGATATRNAAAASMDLAVAAAGERVVRQTRVYHPVQPGKAFSVPIVGCLRVGGGAANCRSRLGVFDDAADKSAGDDSGFGDGVFFELAGAALRAVLRSSASGSPVDTPIEQSAWNLDKLDGTGSSGKTLDPGALNTFIIEGSTVAGSVRLGALIDGRILFAHEFRHDGASPLPLLRTLSLPVRFEIESTGAGGAGTMRQTRDAFLLEGGFKAISSRVFAFGNDETFRLAPAGVDFPLIAFRAKASHRRCSLLSLAGSISQSADNDLIWKARVGGAVSGGAWADVSPVSAAQYNRTATTISGGSDRLRGQLSDKSREIILPDVALLFPGANMDGSPVEFAIIVKPKNNTSAAASAIWAEC